MALCTKERYQQHFQTASKDHLVASCTSSLADISLLITILNLFTRPYHLV